MLHYKFGKEAMVLRENGLSRLLSLPYLSTDAGERKIPDSSAPGFRKPSSLVLLSPGQYLPGPQCQKSEPNQKQRKLSETTSPDINSRYCPLPMDLQRFLPWTSLTSRMAEKWGGFCYFLLLYEIGPNSTWKCFANKARLITNGASC